MNRIKYFLAVGVALLSLGCPARSLFPLFTENDLASMPAIVGTWVNGEGESFSIQPSGDHGYTVVGREKDGATVSYTVQLGKLGRAWFLDSYPAGKSNDDHLISAHIISKILLDGDSLQIAPLESDWLKKKIEAGDLQIPHVTLNDDIILTASTEELQQLVLSNSDDDGAFPKSPILVRRK